MTAIDDVCQAIYDCEITRPDGSIARAFWFDKIILTSGKVSIMYADHRTLSSDPHAASLILDQMERLVAGQVPKAEFIVSSAEAGVYWGSIIADRLNLGFAYWSKKGKIAGAIPTGRDVFAIDDLNTTFGTVRKVVDGVRDYGSTISRVAVSIDRGEYTPDNLEWFNQADVDFDSVVKGQQLIEHGLNNNLISEEDLAMVEKYQENEDECAIDIITENAEWFRTHDRLSKAKAFYTHNDPVLEVIDDVLAKS